jgi:hypothetical protein
MHVLSGNALWRPITPHSRRPSAHGRAGASSRIRSPVIRCHHHLKASLPAGCVSVRKTKDSKRARTPDHAIGQRARYIGWVKQIIGKDHQVRGVIVAKNITENLRYAPFSNPQRQSVRIRGRVPPQTRLTMVGVGPRSTGEPSRERAQASEPVSAAQSQRDRFAAGG